jgi:rhodanese-related sulfurtransferase
MMQEAGIRHVYHLTGGLDGWGKAGGRIVADGDSA